MKRRTLLKFIAGIPLLGAAVAKAKPEPMIHRFDPLDVCPNPIWRSIPGYQPFYGKGMVAQINENNRAYNKLMREMVSNGRIRS